MKTIITICTLFAATAMFAQEEQTRFVDEEPVVVTPQEETDNVRPQHYVEDLQTPDLWIEQAWPEDGIVQPTHINELPNGTMPLSKDLPYVHTIRGYVYTAEHLRYSVR